MKKVFGVLLLFVVACVTFPHFGELMLAIIFGLCLAALFGALMLWLATLFAKAFGLPLFGMWLINKRKQKQSAYQTTTQAPKPQQTKSTQSRPGGPTIDEWISSKAPEPDEEPLWPLV